MALWTLYRNFKARYTYFTVIFKLEFQYHSAIKMFGVLKFDDFIYAL